MSSNVTMVIEIGDFSPPWAVVCPTLDRARLGQCAMRSIGQHITKEQVGTDATFAAIADDEPYWVRVLTVEQLGAFVSDEGLRRRLYAIEMDHALEATIQCTVPEDWTRVHAAAVALQEAGFEKVRIIAWESQ